MSSHRDRPKPIARVKVKITLHGDEALLDGVSKKEKRASRLEDGGLSLSISAPDPQEALERVRSVSAAVKSAQERSKDFK